MKGRGFIERRSGPKSGKHFRYRLPHDAKVAGAVVHRRRAFFEIEQAEDGDLCGSNGILHGEDGIVRYLAILAKQCEVFRAVRNHVRPIALRAREKLARDERHSARQADTGVDDGPSAQSQLEIREQFDEDFLAGTLAHRLPDRVADRGRVRSPSRRRRPAVDR
jgi:hypothetical protein